jgi:asparagine synthase (glutamine-hydrolysing)
MCGICGQIGLNKKKASVETVAAMTEMMCRRGPDAMGLFIQNNTALGHRRLKIIDLSESAQQPMVDNTLGLSIVYNGAIYNYDELRSDLIKRGYAFFSSGDTEVILKAYHAWGKNCVDHFNGMFAFAIVHRDSGEIFLARDRLGIKPLYYIKTPDEFRFASSLPALLAGGGVDTSIDPVALNFFMTFHSVVPAPHTILKGVKKLPPASHMTLSPNGSLIEAPYWELMFTSRKEEENFCFDDWKEKIRETLLNAVQRRLTADVPVGVLLSGGVDSSLVVGLLAELGQQNLNTFSIGFENVNGEKGNEFEYSDIIAETFGTVHHKIQTDSSTVLPTLEHCIRAMNEPMVSHDCIGFYLLSETVSKHVKVVQSGQGADEIFGGYHWYPPLLDSCNPVYGYVGAFFDRSYTEYAAAVHPRFVDEDYSFNFVENHFARPGAKASVDKALRIDTTVMLVDDPVKRVDNMTMAWGLEARVPFLDHKLVELAARIPAKYKIKAGGKHILKEAARSIIPSAVIDRPKGYFPVPALKYLKNEYIDFVREILLAPRSRERKIFNPDYIEKMMEKPNEHLTPLKGSKLWQMASLEYWLTLQGL